MLRLQQSEVAAVLPGEDKDHSYDVLLELRSGEMQRISEIHRYFDPLHCVLLLPEGTDGYQCTLKTACGQMMSGAQFYRYQLQHHDNESYYNLFLHGK